MIDKDYFLSGQVLCIDKPLEWSSFHAVNAIKWALKRKYNLKKIKVGHAGTLDPLATGLLIVCTGKATKQIQEIQSLPKEYTGTMVLGATRPSYDMETEIDKRFGTKGITEKGIHSLTTKFTGLIDQKPPVFSAVKKDGKRLYEFAREGKEVEVPARKVEIYDFDILSVKMPEVDFLVRCSKGTYIRSLVHDFGQELGCGAYLSALRRTKIGPYNVNNSLSPDGFKKWLQELA